MKFSKGIKFSKKGTVKKSEPGNIHYIALAAIAAVSVFFTIQTSAYGATLAALERQALDLTEENELLQSQIVQSSSLSSINEMTEDLGFIKPTKVLYITDEETVAKVP